jgi:hypothetical protein
VLRDGRAAGRTTVNLTWTPPAYAKAAAMAKAAALRPSDLRPSDMAPAPVQPEPVAQSATQPQQRIQTASAAPDAMPAIAPSRPQETRAQESKTTESKAPESRNAYQPALQAFASASSATVVEVPPPSAAFGPVPGDIAAGIKRAEMLIGSGDVAAARLVLHRAAEAGDAQSALMIGTTYDPSVLARLGVRGVTGDVAMARDWYEKARKAGSADAVRRLETLASRQR